MIEVALDKEADLRRTWAMAGHLCAFVSIAAPFGGLIGTIVVYSMRRSDVPYVSENARHALNAQITATIVTFVFLAVYVALFFTLFFAVPFGAAAHSHADAPPPRFYYEFGSIFLLWAVAAVLGLTTLVWHGFGARAAYLGKIFKYPWAIPFVRA